jgi:peptide/nickel transport system ATP-binding protein
MKQDGEKLAAIPGMVPSLMNMPSGCAFSPRCKFAIEACRAAVPALEQVNPQHRSRCIRWQEI